MRKHWTQMSELEQKQLLSKVKKIIKDNQLVFSPHMNTQMKHKGITQKHIDLLRGGFSIIEYHEQHNKPTVLIRSNWTLYNEQVCLAVILAEGIVKTVWLNHVFDNHRTIDWSQYDEKMDIIS
jgi:phosphopantothenoylcysteine synthetase/decarboxylase